MHNNSVKCELSGSPVEAVTHPSEKLKIFKGYNFLAVFSDGSAEFEEVIKEWQLAPKWLRIFAIPMFFLLAMEFLLWDQLGAVRSSGQDYLRSIGL